MLLVAFEKRITAESEAATSGFSPPGMFEALVAPVSTRVDMRRLSIPLPGGVPRNGESSPVARPTAGARGAVIRPLRRHVLSRLERQVVPHRSVSRFLEDSDASSLPSAPCLVSALYTKLNGSHPAGLPVLRTRYSGHAVLYPR